MSEPSALVVGIELTDELHKKLKEGVNYCSQYSPEDVKKKCHNIYYYCSEIEEDDDDPAYENDQFSRIVIGISLVERWTGSACISQKSIDHAKEKFRKIFNIEPEIWLIGQQE